jgi:predicted NUDIX family NTP pyrophosphohydrolase
MRSAGILLFRRRDAAPEVFLVHPGGPFFARKDDGVWSLPKGEMADGEDAWTVANREFHEETGQMLAACGARGAAVALGDVRLPSGKIVTAFAVEGDWPARAELRSNTFELEWPPRSGRAARFPEVDRGGFFDLATARAKIHPGQAPFLDRLLERLGAAGD